MHSAWCWSTFCRVLRFLQIKEGGSNFCGEPISQKVWIICSSLLYFNFQGFVDRNSFSFISSQCILHDSGVHFAESWKFCKLKWGHLISVVNRFCRKCELFAPPFCISILKVLWSQIHSHSLDFIEFCMIQEYFSQSLGFSAN